jgi:hypothetical protein
LNGRSFALVLFFLVIGLAIFQLVSFAVEDPGGLLRNLLTIGIVVVAFYWLYRLFTGQGKNANSSYNRAAKQSKRKYAKPNVTPLNKKIVFRHKEQKSICWFTKKETKAIPFNCH